MNLDKHLPNGTVVQAPAFTRRVIHGIPVIFQLSEWLLFVVAFQYVAEKFQSVPAKAVWLALAFCLSLYVGVLTSNVAWRYIADPFKNWAWWTFMYLVLPAASGGFVFWLLKVVVKDMVAAQVG